MLPLKVPTPPQVSRRGGGVTIPVLRELGEASPGLFGQECNSKGYRKEFTSSLPLMDKLRKTPVPPIPKKRQALEEEILGLLQKTPSMPWDPIQDPCTSRRSFLLQKKRITGDQF